MCTVFHALCVFLLVSQCRCFVNTHAFLSLLGLCECVYFAITIGVVCVCFAVTIGGVCLLMSLLVSCVVGGGFPVLITVCSMFCACVCFPVTVTLSVLNPCMCLPDKG